MANKGTFWNDTFEQILEFGGKTAKSAGQAVVTTLNPLSSIKKSEGSLSGSNADAKQIAEQNSKNKGHTPIDFDKLAGKYQDQDKIKAENLRSTYFHRVKREEEQALYDEKNRKQQKLQQEESEKEQRKRQAQASQYQQTEGPRGKTRKSIFSHKKAAQREQTEVKPASGKQ